MGTDIYALIEYKAGRDYVAWGKPNLPRNYDVFAMLALGDGGIQDDLPYPPRGLPTGYSDDVGEAFFIDGDDARDIAESIGIELEITDYPEWAQLEYVETGRFPNPDWHTPTWLTAEELDDVLVRFAAMYGRAPAEYYATVAAMHSLGEAYGHQQVRIVLWFG